MGEKSSLFIKSLNRSMYDTKPKIVQLYDISNESVIETFYSVSACAKLVYLKLQLPRDLDRLHSFYMRVNMRLFVCWLTSLEAANKLAQCPYK